MEARLNLFAMPFLLAMSLVGNTLNVIVYRHPFLKSSSTVQLLLCRSISHLLFSISLIPNFLYALQNRSHPAIPHHVYASDVLERFELSDPPTHFRFYWSCLKYMVFASNLLNTISIW